MKRFRTAALLAFLVSGLALAIPSLFLEPLAHLQPSPDSSWAVLSNPNHNEYHMWRQGPVAHYASLLLRPLVAQSSLVAELLVLMCGTFLVVRQLSGTQKIPAPTLWLLSSLPPLAVVAGVGLDPFVIGSLSWVPLLSMMLFAILHASREGYAIKVAPLWILTLFVSVQCAMSANQASLFVALLALVFARFVLERYGKRKMLSTRAALCISVVALGPSIWMSLAAPRAPFPLYPDTAHVNTDVADRLPFLAIVGPRYPILTLDYLTMADLYRPAALAIVLLGLVASLRYLSGSTRHERAIFGAVFVTSLCVALDVLLPRSWAMQAPVATLSRLLPWGTVVPLSSIMVGTAAWLVAAVALARPMSLVGIPVAFALLGAIAIAPRDLRAPELPKKFAGLSDEMHRWLFSPSAAVAKGALRDDPKFFQHAPRYRNLSSSRMRDSKAVGATYSLTPGMSEPMSSRPGHVRLHTNIGGQVGGEVLTIQFGATTPVSGIELSPGLHALDFPRGVEITGGDCSRAAPKKILSRPSWQGALRFTSDGYPYWGPHEDVRIIFPVPRKVQCIFVKQTGKARHDWSIVRVRILNPSAETATASATQ